MLDKTPRMEGTQQVTGEEPILIQLINYYYYIFFLQLLTLISCTSTSAVRLPEGFDLTASYSLALECEKYESRKSGCGKKLNETLADRCAGHK